MAGLVRRRTFVNKLWWNPALSKEEVMRDNRDTKFRERYSNELAIPICDYPLLRLQSRRNQRQESLWLVNEQRKLNKWAKWMKVPKDQSGSFFKFKKRISGGFDREIFDGHSLSERRKWHMAARSSSRPVRIKFRNTKRRVRSLFWKVQPILSDQKKPVGLDSGDVGASRI